MKLYIKITTIHEIFLFFFHWWFLCASHGIWSQNQKFLHSLPHLIMCWQQEYRIHCRKFNPIPVLTVLIKMAKSMCWILIWTKTLPVKDSSCFHFFCNLFVSSPGSNSAKTLISSYLFLLKMSDPARTPGKVVCQTLDKNHSGSRNIYKQALQLPGLQQWIHTLSNPSCEGKKFLLMVATLNDSYYCYQLHDIILIKIFSIVNCNQQTSNSCFPLICLVCCCTGIHHDRCVLAVPHYSNPKDTIWVFNIFSSPHCKVANFLSFHVTKHILCIRSFMPAKSFIFQHCGPKQALLWSSRRVTI